MEMVWHTWNGGPWFLLFPLFWLLVIVSAFWLFRRGRGWHHGPTAEEVLAERYARGEISGEEFEQRRQVLRRAR
jgi:putative membrane protein